MFATPIKLGAPPVAIPFTAQPTISLDKAGKVFQNFTSKEFAIVIIVCAVTFFAVRKIVEIYAPESKLAQFFQVQKEPKPAEEQKLPPHNHVQNILERQRQEQNCSCCPDRTLPSAAI